MRNDHRLWIRDWALIGAATSGIAPWPALGIVGDELLPFCLVAAIIGGVSGGAIGLFLRFALGYAPERTWVALAAVVVPIPLGGWGAFVAASSAAIVVPEMAGVAVVCGSVAALLQIAWFAPVYTFVVQRDGQRLTWAAATAITAPACGLPAVLAGMTAGFMVAG